MPIDLAAEISIRAKTGAGAAAAARDFEKVGDAAEQTAVAVEKTTKVSSSAERAWARLQSRIDPLAKAQARLAADTRTLERAYESGVVSAGQRAAAEQRLQRAFEATEKRIRETERAQNGLNRSFSLGRGVIDGLKGAAAGFAAAFSFRAIISGANDAISSLDELAKKARSIGGIGEAGFLQEARFALGNQGLEQETVDKALQRLNRNVGDLRLGGGALQTVLPRLEGGAELAESLRSASSVRQQYELVLAALNRIPDAATRASLATAAFGKEAGANIGAIAEGGVEEFEKLAAEARAAGLVIETDLLERAEVLNDRLAKSGQIVETQMRRAFLSIGPIIADLAEASASFLTGLVRGVDDILNRSRNIGRTTELGELEGVIRTAEEDAARAQARINAGQKNANAVFGGIADALQLRSAENELIIASNRRIEAQERINELIAAQGVSYDDLIGKIGTANAAAENAGDTLADIEEKRTAALARLAAARQGQSALAGFDAKAEIEKAVAESGTVGEAQEAFRKVAEEISRADEETAKLIKSWGGAAKAAKAVVFDPLGDIGAQNERLKALVDAAALGEDELKAARQRFEIEDGIARVKLDAARAGKALSDEEIRALEEELNLNRQLADSLQSREGALQRSARDVADPYRRELFSVADDFIRRLARGDLSSFRDFARDLKNILFDAVLAPFRNAFANLVSGIFSGGGFSPFIPGIGGGASPAATIGAGFGRAGGFNLAALGQTALGFGGLSLGGASSVFGLASLIGPGALGRFGASAGNFLGLSGNLTGGISKALAGAGTFGGALGGIGGSLLSGSLFGKSTAQSIGSTIGGIAGNLIPIPVLGPLIGSFLGGAIGSLFAGKPSDNAAGGGVNFTTFSPENQFAKNNNAQNIQARDQLLEATAALARQLADLTGAAFAGSGISIQVGSRNGTRIISAAGGDVTTPVGDAAAAQKEIVRQLTVSLRGGDAALVEAAKAFGSAGREIDDIVGRLATLKEVLKDPTEIIDPLKKQIDAIVEAFEGLNISTGALKTAFDGALDKLAERTQEALAREIRAADNPLLVRIEDTLKAQAAQRAAISELGAKGGAVDASLLNEFQRRQILSQFNISDRLAQATDPLRFSLDQFLKTQAQELAALTAAVDGVRIRQSDVDALQRAQGAERSQFFSQLSEQDLLKLGGQQGLLDLVEAFGGRIAVVLTRINDEFRRQIEEYDETLDDLRTRVSTLAGQRQNFDSALFGIDRDFFAGTPAQQIDSLRATVDSLRQQALTGTDEEKSFAREQLPGAVQSLLQGSERVFGRGLQFQNDLQLGKSALETVRAQIADEEALAQRQLDTLIASRDIQEEMRDLLAQQTLDRAAFAALAAELDPSNSLAALAAELISLQGAQAQQNAAVAAALTQITPQSIGLTTPVASPADPAPSAALATSPATATASPASAGAAATSSPAPSRDADLVNALFLNNRALQNLAAAVIAQETAQRARDNTQTDLLTQISSALKRAA